MPILIIIIGILIVLFLLVEQTSADIGGGTNISPPQPSQPIENGTIDFNPQPPSILDSLGLQGIDVGSLANNFAPTSGDFVQLPDLVNTLIEKYSGIYNLDSNIVKAQAWQESRGKQSAISSAGAIGVMQLMPSTAAQLGVNPNNLEDNIKGGCMYDRQLLDQFGNYTLMLAAYNAGPGNVRRAGNQIPDFAETQNYVLTILGLVGFSPYEV